MKKTWRRFRSVFGLDPVRDVEDEMSFHVEMLARELVERGETPAHARELALRRFGDYDASRQACIAIDTRRKRHMLRRELFSDRVQDVRYALRMFRRAPAFTLVVVFTLTLGIGVNAAVGSLFYNLLLRPVPVFQPERLVNLGAPGPKPGPKSCGGIMGHCDAVFSYPMFRDLERVQTVFTGIAAHRDFAANLGARGQTHTGAGLFVSGSYFSTLGLQPALGRVLGPDDDRTVNASEVVVLSHEYWQRWHGGRHDVLNETVFVNGIALTVVGVAPQGFEGTSRGLKPEVFVPITMRWRMQPWPNSPPENRRGYWIYLFARLKPGVGLEQARAALDPRYRAIINDLEAPLQQGMTDQMLAQFKAKTIVLEPGSRGQSGMFGEAFAPLTLLLGVTAVMLVISCLNVANLQLARAAARSREVATRLSMGATRGRLVAQFVTEASVLGFAAAGVSLLAGQWTLDLVGSLIPAGNPVSLSRDPSAMIVTGVLALGVTLAIGLFPGLHAVRPGALAALKGQSGRASSGRAAARFRVSLATAQVALSMVLVVLAGLFTKSLANISHVDPGLVPDGLVMFAISPQRNGYTEPRARAFFDRLEEEMAALPGVTGVSSATTPLLSGDERATSVFVEGFDVGPETDRNTRYDEIGDGYFRTLGTPLIAGREFTRADSGSAPKVAIVNERFAMKFGLGRDAVGKRISRDTPALDVEIVGLVKDAHTSSLRDAAAAIYFVPHRQSTRRPGYMTFYLRTSQAPEPMMLAIRQVVAGLDRNLPIEMIRTVHDAMRAATARERLLGVMIAAFAALAMLVAAVGLYGVLAYTVAQRTPEIALRMALGATRADVRWMVLRQLGVITAIGGTFGLLSALGIGRVAQALLFGLQFHDLEVLASATILLVLVAGAAGFLPADRAARVDPMSALKQE
jgi:predicted permease